ncbi:hypothetical protein L4C36_11085 [Photobacterium japonica]|uniref:hypothetical protein n=1 Tax=Photobacterium japonica TaxID=2910235 RepID=UPI003D11CC7A
MDDDQTKQTGQRAFTIRDGLPTWVVVGLGLLLNIVSALMTNFYIDDATQQANVLVQEQQSNDKLIRLVWQQVETLSRKREHIMTVLTVSEVSGQKIPAAIDREIVKALDDWLPQAPETISVATLPSMMDQLDEAQRELRDNVDRLYLDNLRLIAEHAQKMEDISQMRNLALFLQMIGLALVLARDLNRRDYASHT